jgi:GTP diphosphokinase / guanosine-3',5'-bis(diphosphate) 3'-diphosphatase
VRARVKESAADRTAYIDDLLPRMRAELADAGLKAQVEARDRHLYSVYRDLPDGALKPRNATRIVAVVEGTEADCYVALGALHARWRPLAARFRDYVALPKNNMYRSLHTSLLTGDGETVDVIIRNPAMDRVATLGVAAQIREAAGRAGHVTADVARRADLEWLERLLAWQPLAGSKDFLDGMRTDLRTDGVVVFTREGTPVALPRGATAIDFAYAADPETAAGAVGMLVNGMRKPMENRVVHGQLVELVTGPALYPPDSWLKSARTGQAKAHIQQALTRRDAENAATKGRAMLVGALTDRGADLLDLEGDGTAFSVCRRLGYADLDDLYQAVMTGDVTMDGLLGELLPAQLTGRGGQRFLGQAGQVLHQGDQHPLGGLALAGVAIHHGDVLRQGERLAHPIQRRVRAREPVDGHDERHLVVLEPVDRVPRVLEAPGVHEHHGAQAPGEQLVPQVPEPFLPGRAEQVQDVLLVQ